MVQEASQDTKDPERAPAAGPHQSCVSRRHTFVVLFCGLSDGHCMDVFVRGMFSLCPSDHFVCVFHHVFILFCGVNMDNVEFLLLAKQKKLMWFIHLDGAQCVPDCPDLISFTHSFKMLSVVSCVGKK